MNQVLMLAMVLVLALSFVLAVKGSDGTPQTVEAQRFLDEYSARYQQLYTAASEGEWASNTRIIEGDTSNADRTRAAKEALAAFTGSEAVIRDSKKYLDRRDVLTPRQVRELEVIRFEAANNPAVVPDLVKARIQAETAQTEKLFGFTFKLGDREVTTNELDEKLKTETNLDQRKAAWEASKDVGRTLGDGLQTLQRLRNQTVRALGFSDFFSYQVSEYGMTTAEMMALMEKLNRELRPLYQELHTWMRYELAKKFSAPVPDLIPAHWLSNRWSQDWSAAIDVAGFDLDGALKDKPPVWLVEQAERFYQSLGFDPLPKSFYERSSLFPAPPGAPYKKNNHASAWHMDLGEDLRCLMSLESNAEWFETTHHELGHIYYYQAYTRPEVPVLLRRGANRAFHEAVGSLLGLAAMQPAFARGVGLVPGNAAPDPMRALQKEAMNYVVFIPWSAGVMTGFEHDLYARELPREQWNARWWDLVRRYQGVVPPGARGAEFCDPATKTHINDDAAQYYDYALSFVILFQLHDHIATKILKTDPRDTNYYGRRDVGLFLRSILEPGASVDWRELLKKSTGSELSALPMLRYFEPLRAWLAQQNAGRQSTLPPL